MTKNIKGGGVKGQSLFLKIRIFCRKKRDLYLNNFSNWSMGGKGVFFFLENVLSFSINVFPEDGGGPHLRTETRKLGEVSV